MVGSKVAASSAADYTRKPPNMPLNASGSQFASSIVVALLMRCGDLFLDPQLATLGRRILKPRKRPIGASRSA